MKVIDRGEKAVVVSQFTSVLKLLENNLSTKGIKYLVLTGSTNVSHRQQIVETFNEDSEEQVIQQINIFLSPYYLLLQMFLSFYYTIGDGCYVTVGCFIFSKKFPLEGSGSR